MSCLPGCTARRLAYSVGFTLPANTPDLLAKIPETAWTAAYDADGQPREGAAVAELTGLLNLSGWPAGMRVIVRRERPHPGAQLRITDVNGHRITAFATNTPRGQLPDLELRHRRRARCEDRIRIAKDTGLTNLPLHDLDQNRIWCALVMLASSSPPGCKCSPSPTIKPAAGNPNDCGCGCISTRQHRPPCPPATPAPTPRHPWTNLILQGLNRIAAAAAAAAAAPAPT